MNCSGVEPGVRPDTARHYLSLGLVAEPQVSLQGIVGPVALIIRRSHAGSSAAEALLGVLRSVARELHAR